MSVVPTFKMTGQEACIAAVGTLQQKLQKKYMTTAMKKSTRILKRVMKTKAPEDTGILRQSITERVKQYRGGVFTFGIVGPGKDFVIYAVSKTGVTRKMRPNKYIHLVEFGHKVVHVIHAGKKTSVDPKPFMRQTYDQAGPAAARAFEASLRDVIEAYR